MIFTKLSVNLPALKNFIIKSSWGGLIANNLTHIRMKKKYLIPEVDVTWVAIESSILSNGENLNVRAYGSASGEDEEGFWQ